MSSKAYQEVYPLMTEKQKDIMYDLCMKAVSHDGHMWNMYCDIEDAVAAILKEQTPPAQPTLYGYDIKILAFVASVMAKDGMSPEEAVTTFRDINRVIEILLEDMRDGARRTLEQMVAGGRDDN